MIRINLICALAVIMAIAGCSQKPKPSDEQKLKEERKELKEMFRNVVLLRDTSLIKNLAGQYGNRSVSSYREQKGGDWSFFSEREFTRLMDGVMRLVKNPGSCVYSNTRAKPADKDELIKLFVECDSILNLDENGKPVGKPMWACDSLSIIMNICRIDFFESWYLTKDNLIERETLGYEVWYKFDDEQWFTPLFFVFKNEQSRDKFNKYFD